MRPWALSVAVLLSFAAAGCASTQVVHEWRNPELAAPARFKKVMVVEISTRAGGGAARRVVQGCRNPELAAPARFKKVMVVEISTQPGIRRSFEDEFDDHD